MDRQQEFVLRTLEERDIRFVRLWFTDVLGTLKSVSVAPAELEAAFDEGIGFDGSAIEGFARVFESDMVAMPDPTDKATLRKLKPNVAFAVPASMQHLLSGDPLDMLEGKKPAGEGLGLGWICGFNIPITPGFSVSRLAWMEMGGVFAVANLRGGGEYGDAWHRAGTKLTKQNVFDDFIAAAEYLIAEKYTSSKKLAIQGGSNGGLLVGACMTQRPDLFGACLPAVGVMDMLRFQKFTAGRYWVDDYGSSDNPAEFKALYQYSPYHALLRNGQRSYPPTLITTADTDDRVVPGHSFKFAAAMQAAQRGDAPILLRIESRSGHGGGTPTQKLIELAADELAFAAYHLGL